MVNTGLLLVMEASMLTVTNHNPSSWNSEDHLSSKSKPSPTVSTSRESAAVASQQEMTWILPRSGNINLKPAMDIFIFYVFACISLWSS